MFSSGEGDEETVRTPLKKKKDNFVLYRTEYGNYSIRKNQAGEVERESLINNISDSDSDSDHEAPSKKENEKMHLKNKSGFLDKYNDDSYVINIYKKVAIALVITYLFALVMIIANSNSNLDPMGNKIGSRNENGQNFTTIESTKVPSLHTQDPSSLR